MASRPPSPPTTPPCSSPPTSTPPPTTSPASSLTLDEPPTSSPTSDLTNLRPDLLVPSPPTPQHFSVPLGKTIEIRLTEDKKGFGVFALKDIEPGSVILFEEPLLTVPRAVSAPDVADLPLPDPLDILVASLTPAAKEIWDGLCDFRREESESRNRARLWSNGYSIRGDRETGVFGVGSRVNHSCVGGCVFEWRELERESASGTVDGNEKTERGDGDGDEREDGEREREGGLLIWNSWKILEGEEIMVDYGHKGRGREEWYGFVCGCGGCTDGESEDEEMDTEGGGGD